MTRITRRQSIRLSLGGIAATLASPTAATARGSKPRAAPRAKACIVLYMHGGASHIDTFDPKPGRASGGPFSAIGTDVAGIQISEHLPGLASRAGKLAIVRSLSATEGNHDRARSLMHTGYAPVGATQHPALGAMLAAAAGEQSLPGYVAIGGRGHGAGFLGARYGPFVVQRADRPPRYIREAAAFSPRRLAARAELWRAQQTEFAQHHAAPQVRGHAMVMEQALAMVNAPEMAAFDLSAESEVVRRRYGSDRFAQGCLMARRLVEAGVSFVEVGMKGWDTHEDNFDRVRTLSAKLDAGMSALLDDLESRGLLQETLVVWLGDFGRSPRINSRGGRDHHPRAGTVVLAGGGLTTGQLVGATDLDGNEVIAGRVTVPDLMRTLAVATGIDPDHTSMTPQGRPITAVDGGRVIAGLGLD